MMIVDRAEQNKELKKTEIRSIANCDVIQNYIYLGSNISNIGGRKREIKRRCAITRSPVEKLNKTLSETWPLWLRNSRKTL